MYYFYVYISEEYMAEKKANIFKIPGRLKDDISSNYSPMITALLVIVLGMTVMVGYGIWANYEKQIMDNQKEQLLLTSRTLADNMEMALEEYQEDLSFLCMEMKKAGGFENIKAFYREYLSVKSGMEIDVLLSFRDDITSVKGTSVQKQQLVTRISESRSVWLAADKSGRHLFLFRQDLSDEENLCLVIDADRCYEKWVSGIKIGTSGYIMVKNSSGIILMHPQDSQWGIHVISGRKERFPDLDLKSLEDMVETQNRGDDGISEYYSYWWLEEPLVRVRKISGYAPARLGEDFWIISSVVDYDDFNAPIEEGFYKVSVLFIGSFILSLVMLLVMNGLLIERQRSRQEIANLRELNERLEIIHKGEEWIGHQQRLQIIGTMTGGIAHEFNNLLTPIMGYSELLMLELPEDSDAYENAHEIYDASEKAKDVIRQISSLSRRNVETVYKKQDVLPLLARSCKMMHSICPASITLEEDFNVPKDSAILCNSTQINQVLLNLCINAIHAIRDQENLQGTDKTGNVLFQANVISRQEMEASPLLEDHDIPDNWDRYLLIRVKDNGCGMNKEVMRQIFTPFFTTKKVNEGTGLGLTLAEQIVLSHRGYIFAESTPGEGSVFSIFLPLMDVKETQAEDSIVPNRTMRVVIADDNPKILDLLQGNLSNQNMHVEVCRTHGELRHLLEESGTDVLLIDESLGDDSGTDFCMSIQGMYPSVIKIVMAEYPTNALLEAKQQNIIDGYLLKPVSYNDAAEEIRSCIARAM